ncbi:MAG: hypothetical protein J6A01_07075 [Proteobacteria bacterium]|nr:hypothetical protein [Pseudomonadota bacterium]
MTTKHIYLIALLGVLSLYGCSDDSQKGTNATPSGCTSDSECESGKCISGTCQKEEPTSEKCQKDADCLNNQVCNEGKCIDNPPADTKCTKDSECLGDQVCHQGKCEDKTPDPECTQDSECGENQSCVSGHCESKTIPDPGDETCQSDDDCANQELNRTCMPDGLCGHYVNLGETCGLDAYCEAGYECMGVCYEVLSQDAECNPDDTLHVCDQENGMMCIEGACRLVEYNIQSGNECNSYKLCSDGLTCLEGKCQSIQKEDESCDESNYLVCDTGLICKDAKCTPLGKECTQTADCTEKDSFCCLEDSCGAKGHCIPYDDKVTHNESCRYKTKPGIFEAQVQCRWQPEDSDEWKKSTKVEMPPLVGHFANNAGLDNVIAVFSYAKRDTQSPTSEDLTSVIRFINPENCQTIESLRYSFARQGKNMPGSGDLDGDGYLEFLSFSREGNLIAFNWDDTNKKHKLMWKNDLNGGIDDRSNPSPKNNFIHVFDVNGDGNPEVIVGNTVVNGQTGETIFAGDSALIHNSAIGILDGDSSGAATIIYKSSVSKWDNDNKTWKKVATLPAELPFKAYADFGTPGQTPEAFDYTKLDGKPEIVSGGSNRLQLYALVENNPGTYDVQTLMDVKGFSKGGPITIGDFDSDGLPEIGVASAGYFGVYDPQCTGYEAGKCADKHVLWERWSQDESSGVTGSSLFDFDGDGQTEAVYADECFTRVYDGKTGHVLFSAKRSSGTSYEAPVIADIDNDGSAEILMGSDNNHKCADDSGSKIDPTSPGKSNCVDPIHEGIRCEADEDCPLSKNCNTTIGLCTCESDSDCNTQFAPRNPSAILKQYVCAPPIDSNVGFMTNPSNGSSRTMGTKLGTRPAGWTENDYKVCRATRLTTDIGVADLMIYKDRLDRWVSSRAMWNQHTYNIINIEDNGKTPTPAQWLANWLLKASDNRPVYNNYRMNRQGKYGAGTVPDITGRFIAGSICGKTEDGRHVISGKLCNRGTKPVAQLLPATFFYYDENTADHRGKIICTSYTNTIVGVGECGQVGCEVSEEELANLAGKKVLMVTNLNENGNASTVECNTDNNTDYIQVDECNSEITIIN